MNDDLKLRPEGFQRVARLLAERGHAHAPRWLDAPARTCAEAAQALGLQTGQIAKSVMPVVLIDRDLFRFEAVRAVAGHPNGVFCLTPAELVALTGAPVADIAADAPAAKPLAMLAKPLAVAAGPLAVAAGS